MPGWEPETKPPKPLPKRKEGEDDAAYWMRGLTAVNAKPPFGLESDELVGEWMRKVFQRGGHEALEWIWEPLNWSRFCKLSPTMRGRMFHMRGILLREFEDDHKRRAKQAERDRQQAQEQAFEDAARKAGWS